MDLSYLSLAITVVVLSYLASFLFFAVLRIITGVSIQRIGWSGLRHISLTVKDGLRIDIRGLGFSCHRPTFIQPTWISIVVTEPCIIIDPKLYGKKPKSRGRWNLGKFLPFSRSELSEQPEKEDQAQPHRAEDRTWKNLTELKNKLKSLHRQTRWLRMVDLVSVGASLAIPEVGKIEIAHFTLAVDTRRKTSARNRLFQYIRPKSNRQHPLEWYVTARSVLFAPYGKESTELLDHSLLNIQGLLHDEVEGLRDATVSWKMGRLKIPLDDLQDSLNMYKVIRQEQEHETAMLDMDDNNSIFAGFMEDNDQQGDAISKTVSESKTLIDSMLRGIQEFQITTGYFGLSKCVLASEEGRPAVFLNFSMKEIGVDLTRLDSNSPAHRMYFPSTDIAHQGLIAAISISVSIDDGKDQPERLLYIPMATATTRTTLPAKALEISSRKNIDERNKNVLFANLVITSPSVDLDPRHLPLVLTVLQSRHDKPTRSQSSTFQNQLMRRLLPKSSIKISVHEPVVRVTLPTVNDDQSESEDFDLLISVMSSISLDVESSHSAEGELHYSVEADLRVVSHELYYQTTTRDRHNLLQTDILEMKGRMSASPDVSVSLTGNFRSFSIYMVRQEISKGLQKILMNIWNSSARRSPRTIAKNKSSFLRRLPRWLQYFHFQGSNFNVEIAGKDPSVSSFAQGCALHLASWSTEYKTNYSGTRSLPVADPKRKQRNNNNKIQTPQPMPENSDNPLVHSSDDGRRLAVHIHGLEGFAIKVSQDSAPELFLSLPRFEVAFRTSTDPQGKIFHVNSVAHAILAHYSLSRHYCVGMALTVLRKTFFRGHKHMSRSASLHSATEEQGSSDESLQYGDEMTAIDFKTTFIQIKASMPAEQALMLEVYSLHAGKHRWASPFGRARIVRLYTETPMVKKFWSRIVSIKAIRINYRHARTQQGQTFIKERSIDLAAEAMRMAVPYQLIVHKIFSNIVQLAKTTQQLHHRFKTDSDENILEKKPEAPKRIPKVSLRCNAFVFEVEDGAFEWKLGVIYRLGLLEQKQRLAREKAFQMKSRKIHECDVRKNAARIATSHSKGNNAQTRKEGSNTSGKRNNNLEPDEGSAKKDVRRNMMRYDTGKLCKFSEDSRLPVDKAWEKVQVLNAKSWKKRIDHGMRTQTHAMNDLRSTFWGDDDILENVEQKEEYLSLPARPGLMVFLASNLHLLLNKPSFALDDCSKFLHKIGKGMPMDMKYSLLVPMSVQLSLSEARIILRDYPLPLLHIPSMKAGQSLRSSNFLLRADYTIAEEFRTSESTLPVEVVVVPPEITSDGKADGLSVRVGRSVSPVKTFSDMVIEINTSASTKITWGTSYQPAIQHMMQVIEGFNKPAVDPSERVGFWDKIRLSFHSRINVHWKGDGDVHLLLKGSRDPYMVTGHGTGFVMCWQNGVKWSINQHEDPKKFMTVNSGNYVLAIPDLTRFAKGNDNDGFVRSGNASIDSRRQLPAFRKVIMKLSGNVQWLAGLVFERDTGNGERSFKFKPHYDVVLKNPDFARSCNELGYDAFRGFRSNHIHLSIAVAAPLDRDWTVTNLNTSNNYNSVHLTPRFFSHFFNWWSLFQGQMALPVHQGPLWRGIEKSGKKFGRHIATIKYSLLLSPVYISHVYKHKDAEDYGAGVVSATGIKMKMNSLMLDLHQRREEFKINAEGNKRATRASRLKINEVQLDFISADIRAVSVSIAGTDPGNIEKATDETLEAYERDFNPVDISRFTISDNDYNWIDMDDFVELDWILPADPNPETKILPLAFSPRFTYFRQTDHANSAHAKTMLSSPFGQEPTHYCVISAANDPRRVQCDLIKQNIGRVEDHLSRNQHAIDECERKATNKPETDFNDSSRVEALKNHNYSLLRKKDVLNSIHQRLVNHLEGKSSAKSDASSNVNHSKDDGRCGSQPSLDAIGAEPLADYMNDFSNRFVVHNPQIKWNNSLRDIILRYIHQNSQRRGFVYYMSQRAVKFIADILEDQQKSKASFQRYSTEFQFEEPGISATSGDDNDHVQNQIQQLLDDMRKVVNANDPEAAEGTYKSSDRNDLGDKIAEEFTALNTYHVRLIAPQFQLQSEKDIKSAVVVSATAIKLKVVQIMDKDRVFDEVSGLVQRRFSATMDNLQIFLTNAKTFPGEDLHFYAGNRYGAPKGSIWPPWVPYEAMFEFNISPCGFHRIVERTSAGLRMDKYNPLRLKYDDDLTSGGRASNFNSEVQETRIDQIRFDFPNLKAVCDSKQYHALYVIASNLMLYSEPLEKSRSERLEKIILASDFSDLSGAPELVTMLQERIRDLEEIKTHLQINERHLDREGWKSRISLDRELAVCEDELFFIMKAITTAQRKTDDRNQKSQAVGLLRWHITASEVGWHLVREEGKPLAEFQLQGAVYDRIDNNDGSSKSLIEIDRMRGLNRLPNATYPEIISPYLDKGRSITDNHSTKMLRIRWLMLEAIAGIPVVDHFEVNLFPLKLQLEREIGKRLFDYIFPGSAASLSENRHFSPFAVKHMLASSDDHAEKMPEAESESSFPLLQSDSPTESAAASMTGVGTLELRLQPTLQPPVHRPNGSTTLKLRHSPHSSHSEHHFRFFQYQHRAKGDQQHNYGDSSRVSSNADLVALKKQSNHGLVAARSDLNLQMAAEKSRKPEAQKVSSPIKGAKQSKEAGADDLTEMLARASNYMTLAYVKIPSVVLCLSYKGKGQRNLEDINELVFRMPSLEYRNKTWSHLDLALQLKKEVTRALISHAGALVGNKFSHNRLMMKHHPHRLRSIALPSPLHTDTTSSPELSSTTSEANSIANRSPIEDLTDSPRDSFVTGRSSSPNTAGEGSSSTPSSADGPSKLSQMRTAMTDIATSRPGSAMTRSLSLASKIGIGNGSINGTPNSGRGSSRGVGIRDKQVNGEPTTAGPLVVEAVSDKSSARTHDRESPRHAIGARLSEFGQVLGRSPREGKESKESRMSTKLKSRNLLAKRLFSTEKQS